MNEQSSLVVSRGAAAVTVVAVLLIGAGGTYLLMRDRAMAPGQTMNRPDSNAARTAAVPAAGAPSQAADKAGSPSSNKTPGESLSDIVVPLTKDAVERAGIVVTSVTSQVATGELRLPGVVEPNAYRQVSVTPLVGGRLIRVSAQLGDRVRRGASLAHVYSPELAEARTKYVSTHAMLEAHDRELQRTQKLVEIGAASRQELERIHAEHAAQTAEVESARSRLQLLGAVESESEGVSLDQDVSATISVPAPIEGVITERLANVGLNVDPSTKLFTVVDLSTVWVIADLYEKDFQRVRQGARATITTTAYPDLVVEGQIRYIDPQVSAETRTAKLRAEVPNARGDLRLGMYADVVIATAGTASVVTIPRGAVQTVGSHQVVYLPHPSEPSKFIERQVQLGQSAGELVEVVSGLKLGDAVVSEGSFVVRAEAERLGIRSQSDQRR